MPGNNGVATEKVKHAKLVSFTCLKSFAYDQSLRAQGCTRPDLLHRARVRGHGCGGRGFSQRAWCQAWRRHRGVAGDRAQPLGGYDKVEGSRTDGWYRSPSSSWAKATSRSNGSHNLAPARVQCKTIGPSACNSAFRAKPVRIEACNPAAQVSILCRLPFLLAQHPNPLWIC